MAIVLSWISDLNISQNKFHVLKYLSLYVNVIKVRMIYKLNK